MEKRVSEISKQLREVASIETGVLYSRRKLLNDAADRIEELEALLLPPVGRADGWEYKTVETGRKSGTTHDDMWPDGDGWEIDITSGRVGTPDAGWDRFDHHEELYFRRQVPAKLEEGNIE